MVPSGAVLVSDSLRLRPRRAVSRAHPAFGTASFTVFTASTEDINRLRRASPRWPHRPGMGRITVGAPLAAFGGGFWISSRQPSIPPVVSAWAW